MTLQHEDYMKLAFDAAFNGVRNNVGGPFGAVVVLKGEVIGKGCNMVSSTNDPTAHAEIVAIREACRNLQTFNLNNAVLYATCEPCPMCLSAIYWAGIPAVYYCSTRVDAENIGFSDNFIYNELDKPIEERSIRFSRLNLEEGGELFNEWTNKEDKIVY
ncbi:MAG: nucleoside deaminase [Bacteroidota bacterium]|nr:nucleoside deaminase [Bacteroidota bacterium]